MNAEVIQEPGQQIFKSRFKCPRCGITGILRTYVKPPEEETLILCPPCTKKLRNKKPKSKLPKKTR
jgi:transcription elongation factor Elf1